ncbi:MAG: acnA [Herbinix sp.]|jgi:aconitate hydratase|nr:acnA [Herbinix sp.]
MDNLKEKAKKQFSLHGQDYIFYDIMSLEESGYDIKHLPYSIKILLESVLRQFDGYVIKEEHIRNIADWVKLKKQDREAEVPFKPARVLLQDFTGVPAVLDLASMRDAVNELKDTVGNAKQTDALIHLINPEVPVDLVVDHSVQVDCYGTKEAFRTNMELEFQRNLERYQFLNWAKGVFHNFSVIPPDTGIVHQVNLEFLAQVVIDKNVNGSTIVYPDTLVGTDSHTTMINGLGVLGWGVGGIEAEAGMLGQPSYFPIPEVIGVHMRGKLPAGSTATDLALTVTKLLRSKGVVGKFVEYYGDGITHLSLADRATVANMAPEYGATCGFFPVDEETLEYLKLTGRDKEQVDLIKKYLELNEMFQHDGQEEAVYSEIIELDLSTVEAALSGPKRPQDLILLGDMRKAFINSITAPQGNQGHGLSEHELNKSVAVKLNDGRESNMKTGAVAIASITSCTNTSNPSVMLAAGLLAKNAVKKGLKVPAHVKTSLAPGSRVVTRYLEACGLQQYLDTLGFQNVGYGCATCIGNSGPLLPEISEAIKENDLLVTSVLSGNRNFEGRIHSQVKANYLASPPFVVAYALAGTMNIDLLKEPIGVDAKGNEVYLKDIWPTSEEIGETMRNGVKRELFEEEYATVYQKNELWNQIHSGENKLYEFDEESTYIRKPPFFQEMSLEPKAIQKLQQLRVLAKFGDSITTDHISPAGAIGKNTPAGKYLMQCGINPVDFNTYGARRGNHEVMMRGTFANIRIRNRLVPGTEGGFTIYWPTEELMSIYDACMKYKEEGTGLVVLAGKDYGMGSSRDWAAKGPYLLGVKAVIAESYERIHRSNLVMMGVLPLQFMSGENADSLGLAGDETYDIMVEDTVKPRDNIIVNALTADHKLIQFKVQVRFDSEVEVDYYRHGGILQMVLRQKLGLMK